jgi:hypothetical protein
MRDPSDDKARRLIVNLEDQSVNFCESPLDLERTWGNLI